MKKKLFSNMLKLLLVTNGLILLSGAMIGPIYALFVKKIGGGLLDASLTSGFFSLAAGLTTLIVGKFSDRNKRDELIVAIGYIFISLGFFLYIFVNSITFLFSLQILIGIAEAFYSPAFDALYSKHLLKKKEGREWGAWESMNYFSIAGGAIIGGFIVNYLGFNTLFIVMSVLSLISAACMFYLYRKKGKLKNNFF